MYLVDTYRHKTRTSHEKLANWPFIMAEFLYVGEFGDLLLFIFVESLI